MVGRDLLSTKTLSNSSGEENKRQEGEHIDTKAVESESYDHGARTHLGYYFGAYGRNDGDGRWRYPRIMNAFHGNRNYGDEPMVERRLMDRGNLFLLVPSMTNCLSSHFPLEDPSISQMFDPSCHGFGNLNDTSIVELNIVSFALEFDRDSLQHIYTITSMRERRHTMEFKGEWENVGEILILCYGDLTINVDDNLFFDLKEFNTFNRASFRRTLEEESEEASSEGFEASMPKDVGDIHTVNVRSTLPSQDRGLEELDMNLNMDPSWRRFELLGLVLLDSHKTFSTA
ncbi:hypothetical protein M9H77_26890 [Catharanthus roseus]|uniref:Uncharacterized protein n=1 Tax=Catharanthus roseus TaxID=4058 RepID=A0ACC0ADN2_CATRO|nr:hypothetical protein M9H77_26890 [Catharanthus roseus]